MDLLLKKSNKQFDEFCNALHVTEQMHIVKNQLITQGTCVNSKTIFENHQFSSSANISTVLL